MEERNIALYIIATLLTCGIFGLYWMYCINNDTNNISNEPGTEGSLVVVFSIITCGIYTIYWAYKMGEQITIAKNSGNQGSSELSILYLVLALFGLNIIGMALMQSEINRIKLNYNGH
ncbi:DUF4234 domain-containing protein [Anaerovorax odorimutans]|uniref:DUF4234 domain-containing protein n=1 Tax=Anaerovorax odorimutans TaxID=109327 RepID=UPI0003FE0331|nr:DUF4234 domain-containing protein [Anaerovorax odorimutans]